MLQEAQRAEEPRAAAPVRRVGTMTVQEIVARIVGLAYWEGLDVSAHMATTARALFFKGRLYLKSRMEQPEPVVVKMPLYGKEDILREASVLKRTGSQHDHIIRRLAFFRDPWPVLVLEEGRALGAMVPAPGAEAARVLLSQVASALEYLHVHVGIVHGDVNVGNVVVVRGMAKLIDFRSSGEAGVVPLHGFAVWNDAPEARAGFPLVPSMDVWGLGGMLALFGVDVEIVTACRRTAPERRITAAEARARLVEK